VRQRVDDDLSLSTELSCDRTVHSAAQYQVPQLRHVTKWKLFLSTPS